MRSVALTTHSLADLLRIVEGQPGGYGHLFRGQGNASWGLTPSLYRIQQVPVAGGSMESNYDTFEEMALAHFYREAIPYLPPIPRSYSNDRIVAQHFGVPTRLLDWTRDPLVAAYFASVSGNEEADGAIFMLLPDAHYLPEHVRGPGPHQAIAFEPPAIDRRIPAQKSVFTFHPYGASGLPFVPLDQRDIGNWITTDGPNVRGFVKITIPALAKQTLHSTLIKLGIDRRNLFPGLDGVGADVAERVRFGGIV